MNQQLLRPAVQGDLSAILDVYNDAIVNTTAVYSYRPHTMEMRQAWYDEKIEKGIPVLVMEIDGQVAGFASYGPFRAWPAYKYSVEHSVYVHKNFRQRGVARKLLEALVEQARAREVHTLIAGIDANNTASLHLHAQLGFEEVGHIRQVGYKFGQWLDLKFLQRVLDTPTEPNENPPA
ncbi:GNAT family N-acetyltransferase [Chryseolinea lacunae]|uniref:N-acetyltransferase n=1 Tax=Chryseolinea lacunae TaxID=2801331 RepID=A0ABS1KM52_9BACT|nr:GNAT family N-acetyltransferase [Chryseolinea lacunae]MBL0740408.1 N-acetyltransferase [Chryseolinea lacunae]